MIKFLYILLLLPIISQAQNYYKVDYNFETSNELYEGIELEYSLEFSNNNESIFIHKSEFFENKVGKWEVEVPENNTFCITEGNTSKQYRVFNSDTTLIEETIPIYDWEITDEKQTIAGYTTYKAVAKAPESTKAFLYPNGMDGFIEFVYVWFTKELPYPYGPSEFIGLPGVVLKVEFSNIEESLVATNVTKIDTFSESLPKYPIKITMDAIYTGKWYKKSWRKKQKASQYPTVIF